MFATLSFIMVACLFANLVYEKGAAVYAATKAEVTKVTTKL